MLNAKEQGLLEALEEHGAEQGVEIVTVELSGSKKAPRVAVYIDTPEGVDFDTLQSATQWIGELMDELDPFPGAYSLEISSPGIDRPLRTPAHFAAQIGSTAVVRLVGKRAGRGTFTGVIVAADEEGIELNADGEAVRIAFDEMKRANVKGTVDFSRKD